MKIFIIIALINVSTFATAFVPVPQMNKALLRIGDRKSSLFAAPVGPVAMIKKLQDPKEYNRVVEEKMKKSKMTREEAETDYNEFLENPPFYYALEKKVCNLEAQGRFFTNSWNSNHHFLIPFTS